MKSNFIKRTITGVIFVAVVVGCILWTPLSFTILFTLVSVMTVNEFANIISHSGEAHLHKPMAMLASAFLFIGFAYLGIAPGKYEVLIPYLFLLMYMMVYELYRKDTNPLHNWAYTMMSQLYIALPFALLNLVAYHTPLDASSGSSYNPILPLSIFIFTWLNDTGAYCTGVLIGKHHLFPRISPKKTWEGSIGGAAFCIIASLVLAHFYPFLSQWKWIGLALTIVVFGTWGDLVESLLKRTLGIKDSGTILPGHGGLLDRFDSTLMAVPASVVYLYLISSL